jgi:hypothetical protein
MEISIVSSSLYCVTVTLTVDLMMARGRRREDKQHTQDRRQRRGKSILRKSLAPETPQLTGRRHMSLSLTGSTEKPFRQRISAYLSTRFPLELE